MWTRVFYHLLVFGSNGNEHNYERVLMSHVMWKRPGTTYQNVNEYEKLIMHELKLKAKLLFISLCLLDNLNCE